MANPYDSPDADLHAVAIRRPVRAWAILSASLLFVAAATSLPAFFILNQELDLYPFTVGLVDIESGGESLSLHSAMTFLFCVSLTTLALSATCGATAWYNSRANRKSLGSRLVE